MIIIIAICLYPHLFLQGCPGAGSGGGNHWRRPEADPGERVVHQAVRGTNKNENGRGHCYEASWSALCVCVHREVTNHSFSVLLDSVRHHRHQWHLQGPGDDGPRAGRHDRWASAGWCETVTWPQLNRRSNNFVHVALSCINLQIHVENYSNCWMWNSFLESISHLTLKAFSLRIEMLKERLKVFRKDVRTLSCWGPDKKIDPTLMFVR